MVPVVTLQPRLRPPPPPAPALSPAAAGLSPLPSCHLESAPQVGAEMQLVALEADFCIQIKRHPPYVEQQFVLSATELRFTLGTHHTLFNRSPMESCLGYFHLEL